MSLPAFKLMIFIFLETLFNFTMNPVTGSEDPMTVTQVCVELLGAIPSSPITLMLDPTPGSASSELLVLMDSGKSMSIIILCYS